MVAKLKFDPLFAVCILCAMKLCETRSERTSPMVPKSLLVIDKQGIEVIKEATEFTKNAVTKSSKPIFMKDHHFIKRVAMVENSLNRTSNGGGLWNVDECTFQATQANNNLTALHKKVRRYFNVTWSEVRYSDLRRPLYSVLAARITLEMTERSIPRGLRKQARFWLKTYHSCAEKSANPQVLDDKSKAFIRVVKRSCHSGFVKCEHECHHTNKGRAICRCREGYTLESDGKSCAAVGCQDYKTLSDAERKDDYVSVYPKQCDSSLSIGWYRFQGAAGTQMATTCPPENRCDASFPGWLSDGHPTVAEGEVTKKVCFHKFGDCCRESRYIQVRNCSSYYVYKLVPARSCYSRYCGAEKILAAGCQNYQTLSDAGRKQDYVSVYPKQCDSSLSIGWYRFQGAAGTQMATTCPPEDRCDASFPGWLSDGHPTVAEGEVTRKVCFHKFGDCCRESRYIQVRNCDTFYIYKLVPAQSCDSRYCGTD